MVGKELIQKQRMLMIQLICLLKQIESQTLTDHQVPIHKCFQTAMAYLVVIHQISQNHGTFLIITLKLL
ncbi:hypothetical protein ACSBR2_023638 [Camellia fascicularis]